MSEPVTDADRIAAEGVTIQTIHGAQQLRYTLRSLKSLEDHYGALDAAANRLNELLEKALAGLTGPVITDLGVFVAAGLGGISPDEALELLPTENMRETILLASTAAVGAWMQAFPAPSAEGNGEEVADTGSPGATSTGSSPESPADPTTSSG